jgi:hypothetical protein
MARWFVLGWVAMLGTGGCAVPAGGAHLQACSDAPDGHSTNLACTGLYADFASAEIAPDVLPYDPSIHLWSDGAEKRRFIRLPPGTAIDTHDMDHWVFPAGTKFWKEFSLGGRRAETRYLEKRLDGTWFRTTYVWSPDQTSATELTDGVSNVWGTGYEIPAQSECATCHEGAPGGVLGFEAIGLSTPAASGLTMAELERRGLVTHSPASPLTIPGTPTDVAALGWLHVNCGNACHNRTTGAYAHGTGLFMRLTAGALGGVQETDTYATAVGVPSRFQPNPGAGFLRIKPGDVAHSAIAYRALARDDVSRRGAQMPPIATHVPDMAGVALVHAWILELAAAAVPTPEHGALQADVGAAWRASARVLGKEDVP